MKQNIAIGLLSLFIIMTAVQLFVESSRVYRIKGKAQTITLLRDASLASTNLSEIADNLGYLRYVVPNSSRRSSDPDLDRLVEVFARTASGDIIARMKEVSGRDLGQVPETWINAYSPQAAARGTNVGGARQRQSEEQ